MRARTSQNGRLIAAAFLLCVCLGTPLASAQETGDTPEPAADASTTATSGETYDYVLPSSDDWRLNAPKAMVASPTVAVSPPDGPDRIGGEAPLSAEDNAIIDKALALDAAELAARTTASTTAKMTAPNLRLPGMGNAKGLDATRTDNLDGSKALSIKQTLTTDWDAKVGADLNVAGDNSLGLARGPLDTPRQDSGAAWASVSVPHIATLDARVDPNNDLGSVGTAFERELPLGGKLSVKLRSYYSITETMPQPQAPVSESQASHVWGNEHVAKLNILPTGTTLGAGIATTSADPVTHNTLSAEQKIYGPLSVTTAVTDVGQASQSKSVSAGFKLNW